MTLSLLIAEDDRDMAAVLAELARGCGYRSIDVVHDGAAAEAHLRSAEPDVLITDLCLPPPDGLALLALARELYPDLPVVMVTGYATTQNAIDAFRAGVFDIITKPFSTAQIRSVLSRLSDLLHHRRRIEQLDARLHQLDDGPAEPVAQSRSMREAQRLIAQAADTDIPVLLTGETGTGKSRIARLLHALGPRRDGPFFGINCAGVAVSLAESELFGHEKGAFTGATARKKGLLELADGGTLLLDEINSAPPQIQVRLLQFLQDRTLVRVGGQQLLHVDVRLVCAANESLERLVQEGRFRADLYYRLKVFPVDIPPLRERREDVLPLAERFLSIYSGRYARDLKGFEPAALACLRNYAWPGNVRELENIVQRAVVLAERGGEVGTAHLPAELVQPASAGQVSAALGRLSPDAPLAEVESFWIRHMLARCHDNKREAARRLGINASTLHRKLR